jgi:hypothetical protein
MAIPIYTLMGSKFPPQPRTLPDQRLRDDHSGVGGSSWGVSFGSIA